MKKIYKAIGIQGDKELEVKIIDPNYNDDAVEVIVMEGTWEGHLTVVSKCNIKEYNETLEETFVKFLEKEGYDYELMGVETWYRIFGYEYNVNAYIDLEENEIYLETLNLNVDYDKKKTEDIYFNDGDEYKNRRTVKTIKGLKGYLKKFIG